MKYKDHVNVHTPYEQHIALVKQQKIWISEALRECEDDLKESKKYRHTTYIPAKQHKIMADLQKIWSNEAKRDAIYNYNQYIRFQKDGRHILAEGYKREYEWSMLWYNLRKNLSKLHNKLMITDTKDKYILTQAYMQEHYLCKKWVHRRLKILEYHEKMAYKLK
jgi:hypothetical protein